MKKYTLLIVAGSIFLVLGVILSMLKKNEVFYIYEETKLSQEEATALIIEKVKNVMDVYEKQKDIFNVVEVTNQEENIEESNNEYIKINNYEEVIKDIFTEEGIEEIEKIEFEGKKYIEKREDGVYVLSSIPLRNRFSDSSISVSISMNVLGEVKAVVSFTSDEIDDKDVLIYHIYEKNIDLVKKDDKWLIKSFNYSNA